jgi:hypothetical protein
MHEPCFQYILQGHFGRRRRPHLAGDPNTVNKLELIHHTVYIKKENLLRKRNATTRK